MAWDQGPRPGKKPLAEWCREFGVTQARSVEEVIDKCDAVVVLAPDHVEKHEELAALPPVSYTPMTLPTSELVKISVGGGP